MATPLILSLDGHEFPVSLLKIDREKLYGSLEIEAFDEKGNEASLKVLAADGKTLLDKGGTALTTVNEKGMSISRTELEAVDENGDKIEPVPSSFGRVNVLKPAEADDYLSQIVKSVYLLQPVEESDVDFLKAHLATDRLYTFPFSYRGGLEYDNAFLVRGNGDAFMVVGKQGALQFVKLNQAAELDATEEQEISGEELEFDLL